MKNEIGSGIFLNYINIVLFMISSLIITPFLINGMGLSMYGVYVIVFSISVFFNAGDFGIAVPFIRNIVEYRTSGNKKGLENYLFNILWIYACFAASVLIIWLIIFFCAPFLFRHKFDHNEILMFDKMFLIMAINCMLLFFVNYFFAIITAFDKFSFTRIAHIIRAVLRTILLLLVVLFKLPPYTAYLVDLLLTASMLLVYAIFCFNLGVRIRQNYAIVARVKNTVSAMILTYWMAMSENAFSTLCPIIITAALGTEDTSRFSIAITFITIYVQLSATLSQLRIPKLSELWFADDNRVEFWNYTLKAGRIQTVVLGLILVMFTILGQMFLKLWVGSEFAASYFVALVIMCAMYLSLSQSMLEVSLYAQNKYLIRSVVLFVSSMLNLLLVGIGVKFFGLMGSGYALMITTLLFNFLGMNLYYRRVYPKMNEFNFEIIIKMLIPVTLSAVVGFLIVNINPDSILFAAFGALAGLVLYSVSVYFVQFRGMALNDIFTIRKGE